MNKTDALEFAKQFGWTEADAKRAYTGIDLKNSAEQDLMFALVKFAGPELINRQNLQKAQKTQVTIRKKQIEKIKTEFVDQIKEYEDTINTERSIFISIIQIIYPLAKRIGLNDPLIEAMLIEYDEYKKRNSSDTNKKVADEDFIDEAK